MHTESTIGSNADTLPLVTATPVRNKKKQRELALQDILAGLKKSHVWLMMGQLDIKLRYRRSVLGPFWITISMAITILTMGFLYGHLFHSNISSYLPFLMAGMLSWALISSTLTEITEGFVAYENLIKQIKLPYSLYIHRILWRNLLVFFHNLVVLVPVILIFRHTTAINLNTLLIFPHLILYYINAFSYGLIIAIMSSRYRDMPQMIKSLIQVIFFLTPIMWAPTALSPSMQPLIISNPFYDFIELLRAPMLGYRVSLTEYAVIFSITLLGLFLSVSLFAKYRSRIVYWL